VRLRSIDGGPSYFRQWTENAPPNDTGFFPIGVWQETGTNAQKLRARGINMIINPVNTPGIGVHNISALEDEADMWAGAGTADWTGKIPGEGNICSPDSSKCGFSVMLDHQSEVAPGEMRYANYGKGVVFWESDADAARFVNDYQDVVSVDLYWATDPDLCQASQGGSLFGAAQPMPEAECHKASNYGRAVDRVRDLVSPRNSKPVWAYVELGQPTSNSPSPIPIPEIKAAVWSSIIHEARGIVYFNHSFGGPCQSQHVLDDCDPNVAPAVTALNAQVTEFAPTLNSATVDGFVSAKGADTLAKGSGGDIYIFAGSNKVESQYVTLHMACGLPNEVEVVDEDRNLPVGPDGTFSDRFDDSNAYHIYRVPAAAKGCGV